jgi:hypothetical protein
MSLPAVGGLIWVRFGHPAVFLAAAGIAVLMLIFSLMVRTPPSVIQADAAPNQAAASRAIV